MCRYFAVTLLCLYQLAAQEPAAPPPTVFSVSTTLVQLDCIVTDGTGHQVTNLKPEDFEVLLGGKPQAITNFSYIRLDSPDVNRPSLSPQAQGNPPASANAAAVLKPEDVRRSMVLVVDDLSLSFESMVYVQRALRKFVNEQMRPGDLVALWETGRSNSVFQQFTSDRRVLAAAIDNLRWNPRGLGLVSPFGPDLFSRSGGRRPNATTSGSFREQTAATSDERAYVRLNTTVGALDVLSQLMEELRPVGGRKAVVLFSDGIFLPGIDLPGHHTSYGYVEELRNRFRRMIDKANRSGVVVYTVDARGLVYLEPAKIDSLWLSQEGLVELAESTGGVATVNGNGFSQAIERVENDETGYYLIGFKAPANISTVSAGAKADFHSIRVKVERHGLTAHSRTGFFGETDDVSRPKYNTRQEQMFAAVHSLFNKSDLNVRLTALYRRTAEGQSFVHNLLYIDPRQITFQTDLYGVHYAALDLYILASGYGVDPLASVSRHISIDADEAKMKKLQADGLLLTLDVPVKHPGPYQVRACVLDSISRAVGSAGQYIDVPDLKKQHMALTTPLIDDLAAPVETRFNDVPSALREFRAGSRLAFAFRIETEKDSRGSLPPGKYDTRIQLYRDRTPVLDNPVAVAPVAGQDGRSVAGELRLNNALPPGQYYLQAMATDRGAKTARSASSWIEFQVVP